MLHKQFVLIATSWFLVISLLFCSPAKSEPGIVHVNQPLLCDESIKDLAAAVVRAEQLKEMLAGTTNEHAKLVLGVEMKAVLVLGKKISMWRVENCRDA